MSVQSPKNPQLLVLFLWIMIMFLNTVHFTDILQQEVPIKRFIMYFTPSVDNWYHSSMPSMPCVCVARNPDNNQLREMCRGLSTTDSNPITNKDRTCNNATMRAVQDKWVFCLKLQLNSLQKGLKLTIMSIKGDYKVIKYLLRVKA